MSSYLKKMNGRQLLALLESRARLARIGRVRDVLRYQTALAELISRVKVQS